MRKLDFISKPPNFSIFKEGANKTNLGGFLFVIYIAIILILAIVYFYDYFANDKYQFNYTVVKKNEDANIFLKNMSNVELNFMIWLKVDGIPLNLNKNFIIVDLNKSPNDEKFIIEQLESFNASVNGLNLGVLYRCNGNNCTIRDEDKIKVNSYYFYFCYRGFSINHQDPEKPIQLIKENSYYVKTIQFLNNTNIVTLNWEVIEYEEEKGVFGKTFDKVMGSNKKYYGGDYKLTETITDDGHFKTSPQTHLNYTDPEGNDYILLLLFNSISIPVSREYERYTRKKVSVMDILANIASLSSTALNLMGLVYGILYAENYNNYKIIESILTKKMKININKSKKEDDIENVNIELKGDLKEKDLIEDNVINGDDSDDTIEEENEKMKSSSLNLSVPRFIDFLVHKFYSKCCGYSSKHILINSCNDIVAKYTTIENILYNQMKLECLWKDYKWNNPQFQKKDKEDLLLDLKEK